MIVILHWFLVTGVPFHLLLFWIYRRWVGFAVIVCTYVLYVCIQIFEHLDSLLLDVCFYVNIKL